MRCSGPIAAPAPEYSESGATTTTSPCAVMALARTWRPSEEMPSSFVTRIRTVPTVPPERDISVNGRCTPGGAVASCLAVTGPTADRHLRVLHTSDVHIGHVRGPHGDHHDVCQCPAHALAHAVAAYEAHVLLIAGDLFDHARLQRADVAHTLELLGAVDASVVIIPGNHDVHDERSLCGAPTPTTSTGSRSPARA